MQLQETLDFFTGILCQINITANTSIKSATSLLFGPEWPSTSTAMLKQTKLFSGNYFQEQRFQCFSKN